MRFGKLNIHRHKIKNHPHVVVERDGKKVYSVGLTHSEKSGHHKLHRVYESNGQVVYMLHSVSHDKESFYAKNPENYKIDEVSEARAKAMVNHYKNKKK